MSDDLDNKTKSFVARLAADRGHGRAETIQEALALLKFLDEQQRGGARIVVIDANGNQKNLVVTTSDDT